MDSVELRGNILNILKKQGPISGESLAQQLGFSRVALWKHVEALRTMGYNIVGCRGGYTVSDSQDLLYPWEFPGMEQYIHYYPECGSTMDEAELLVSQGAPEGSLVLAGVQTKGRGRLGRVWESPVGGIYGTLIVRPEYLPLQEFWTMQWRLIVSIVRAVREIGVDASIKWPNDLLVGSKKLTGVIAETRSSGGFVEWGLLGFGINCNNQVPEVGVSLGSLLGTPIDRKALIRGILTHFQEVRVLSIEELTQQWRSYTSTLGRKVTIDMGGGNTLEGVAKEVFSDGSLVVVDTQGEEHRCYSGDCLY